MLLEKYLKNPCGESSVPYWKSKIITLPENMLILHDKDFNNNYLYRYNDEKYFRLYHDMKNINTDEAENVEFLTVSDSDISYIVEIINKSYEDVHVSNLFIEGLKHTTAYNPDLWILIKDKQRNRLAACGIGDYDEEAKELALEWIQVLPEYRGRKIGQAIVNELLRRMQGKADFATVSGKIDNNTKPEMLYRKCGFVGDDVWHVMTKKD